MTDAPTRELVPVTQEDKEAAADFATRYLYPNCSGVRRALAYLLARHRLAAYRAGLEAAAKVAEANAPITIYPGSHKIDTVCQLISEQILALAQQDGGEG